MRLFYKAITKDGKIVRGTIEAKDIQEAGTHLRGKGLLPVKITVKKKAGLAAYLPFLGKIKSRDVVFMTRQLASMLASGLTLMQALSILKQQVQNEDLSDVVNNVIVDIEEGKSFSQALEKHNDVFSPIYISLIRSSETSGLLDKVLLRLADNLEKQEKLKAQIKSALLYPLIVVTGMVLVVFIMMTFVIPTIGSLYKELNIPLPLPTQIVVGISDFTVNFWPLVLAGIIGVVIFFNRWHKTDAGKLIIDRYSLKLPVFGSLINESILTEFTRTLGLSVGSGTLVVTALHQSADVAGNLIYKNAILDIAMRVEKGVTIGNALSAYSLFPPILVQMAKIGEETGKLDESLLKVSEYFEREVDQSVKNLTTALEPIIIVFLGAGVAFLIIAIITPIYSLISTIQ